MSPTQTYMGCDSSSCMCC